MREIRELLKDYNPKPYGMKRRSAVLLPLIERNNELHVLYEVRSEIIPQPGETSFPGGRVEPNETPKEAAVRETMEELRISREHINVFGEIDYIVSGENVIYCFIGEITDISFEDIDPNEEVARLFTLPLNYLRKNRPIMYKLNLTQSKNNERFPYHLIPSGKDYPFDTIEHRIPFYELKEESLWGFTANLTDRFIQILDSAEYK